MSWLWACGLIVLLGLIFYQSIPRWIASLLWIAFLGAASVYSPWSIITLLILWLFSLAILIPINIPKIRREFISKAAFVLYRERRPQISTTEREAISAGNITFEGELFAGKPRWRHLLKLPDAKLSADEMRFLEGPVETLCNMINDWQITHELTDLPQEVWAFLKEYGFFGMIIPKKYGGLEFSEWGHAAVLTKLYSRSVTLGSTVTVPNSLGPGELLLKYGTRQQKDYYLPRLARGEEIPCFGLTHASAGSDAASIPDTGIICRDKYKGKMTIGIRLNWQKRYITLAPIATVIALAFRLYDPEGFLGGDEDVGITLALIPTDTEGVTQGRRHFPLNAAFLNGPMTGEDVFIPLDFIIGGEENAGKGWGMLMECLSAGRAISLPCSALGGTKALAFMSSAYARIREQFGRPIGQFGGIQEPLARICCYSYMINAAVEMTVAGIDTGNKPSVASAILKYHTTEMMRKAINDAMDIHGGKGICLGPKNYLGRGYQSAPIGITVEGANILTRSLIIFGQGVIRCHPYILKEFEAVDEFDIVKFDKLFMGHMGYIISTITRTLFTTWTGGRLVWTPGGKCRRYFQILSRFSAAYAWISEISILYLGNRLKRREMLSARMGDVLSKLYIASAVMKQFYYDGQPESDLEIVEWSLQTLIVDIEQALMTTIRNFPNRWLALLMRVMVFPLGTRYVPPKDELTANIARSMLEPTEMRRRLCQGIHLTHQANNPIGQMDAALNVITQVAELEKTLEIAKRNDQIEGLTRMDLIKSAAEHGIIDNTEYQQLIIAEEVRQKIIAVDDFDDSELRR